MAILVEDVLNELRPTGLPPSTSGYYSIAVRSPTEIAAEALYIDAYREDEPIPSAHVIAERQPAAVITGRPAAFFPWLSDLCVYGTHDVVQSVGKVALRHRARFAPATVAVTGSTGKSSTTAMAAALCGDGCQATVLNRNDEFDTPLTVLNLDASHKFLVAELGTWRPGEIAFCTNLVQPTVGVVTNVGLSHLSRFGTRAAIASAKRELIQGLDSRGVAILNASDPYVGYMASAAPGQVLTFDTRARSADAYLREITFDNRGANIRACVLGEALGFRVMTQSVHLATNSLAAILAWFAIGETDFKAAAERLGRASLPSKRLEVHTTSNGGLVIDDSFNAAPDSVAALKELVGRLKRRSMLVFGGMYELGEIGCDLNRRALSDLTAVFEVVIPYGPLWSSCGVETRMADLGDLRELTRAWSDQGGLVAFKGSRASGVAQLADACLAYLSSGHSQDQGEGKDG